MAYKTCRLTAIVQHYSAAPRDRLHASEAGKSYDLIGWGYTVGHTLRGRSTRWATMGSTHQIIT
jgi:hypothetical protein